MASKTNYDGRTLKGRASDGWALSDSLDTQGKNKPTIQALFTKPGMYTAQFGLGAVKGDPLSAYKLNPVATIYWKLEGLIVVRKISITDGCCISGVGEACEIKLWDDSALTVGTDQTYVVSCTIGPGTRPPSSLPPMYRPKLAPLVGQSRIGNMPVSGGASYDVTIPTGIGVISAYTKAYYIGLATPPVSNEISAVLREHGGIVGGWDAYYDGNEYRPLGASTDTIQLLNQSAGTMSYTVAFGIDG